MVQVTWLTGFGHCHHHFSSAHLTGHSESTDWLLKVSFSKFGIVKMPFPPINKSRCRYVLSVQDKASIRFTHGHSYCGRGRKALHFTTFGFLHRRTQQRCGTQGLTYKRICLNFTPQHPVLWWNEWEVNLKPEEGAEKVWGHKHTENGSSRTDGRGKQESNRLLSNTQVQYQTHSEVWRWR